MADLSFKLNIVPVGTEHVAILDPQGNFEPLLYNNNQVYVVGENLVRYLINLLQQQVRGGFTWSPGEWTVTISHTADLAAYITQMEEINATLQTSGAGPVSGSSQLVG